jgi:plasmid stability protein
MEVDMADLLIRDIDPEIKRMIKARAEAHDRSLSEETKALVAKALAHEAEASVGGGKVGFGTMLRQMVDDIGGVELELPTREGSERPLPDFS